MKSFFNFTEDVCYCNKSTPIIKADYQNTIPEAASLHLTQQRVIRKILTLLFGSREVESEKKLVDSAEGCDNYIIHDF